MRIKEIILRQNSRRFLAKSSASLLGASASYC